MFKTLILGSLFVGICSASSLQHSFFEKTSDRVQLDLKFQTVIASTPNEAQCANYCLMHNKLFRERECGSFYMENLNCHLIPKIFQDNAPTEQGAGPYFIKKDISII